MVWTETTRGHYDRRGLRYTSDCSDEEWKIIAPFLQVNCGRGRPLCHDLRQIWDAINYIASSIASKIGCSSNTLLKWLHRHEIDSGLRSGISSEEREHIKALERENKELRRANEILRLVSAFFAQAAQRPSDCTY